MSMAHTYDPKRKAIVVTVTEDAGGFTILLLGTMTVFAIETHLAELQALYG